MKTRRTSLSFKLDSKRANLDLFKAGISVPLNPDKEERKKQFEQFGIFGSSSDSNKFYPGLDVSSEVVPKDSDFVKVPFRLLSATIVGAGSWKATDFSNEGVLRASMPDLDQKPVYKDHETDLDNWVGIVDGVAWGAADGDVPAGINGTISIDAVVAPKIARGVLSGIIFSNSVTVEFDWMPSHSFDSAYEFEDRIGQMHEDGTMIRRIVTSIHNYHESSLVWLGADPFAKLINNDGELVHIDKSSVQLSKEEKQKTFQNNGTYSIPFSMPKQVLGLSRKGSKNFKNSTKMNEEQLEFLRNLLGLDANTKLTTEHLAKLALKTSQNTDEALKVANFNKLAQIDAEGTEATLDFAAENEEVVAMYRSQFDGLLTKVTKLGTEKETLETKVTELTADATVGADFIALKRTEVERLYGIFVEGKTDESVLSLIQSCTPEQLDGMLAQYTKGLTTKFSVVVKDESTGAFEFRSSLATPKGGEEDETMGNEVMDYSDIHKDFSNHSMNVLK